MQVRRASARGSGAMILLERADHVLVIRQTDHAVLAGFLAREWGNATFARPELFQSFCLVAREHDNGWTEWEMKPQLDPKTRMPYTFMSIPTADHIAIYQRGIERIIKVDPYAGLLLSMHCAGLYDRARATLPGYSAKYTKSGESRMVSEFLDQLKLRQMRIKSEMRTNPAMAGLREEASLERRARLLEVLDRLSLYFCLGTQEDTTMEEVPVDDGGGEVDCEIRRESDEVVSISPWAFRKDALAISILARRVPKRMYHDADDFQSTLAGAPYFAINFCLRAAGDNAFGQTQSAVA
jgi:hypothetical protein